MEFMKALWLGFGGRGVVGGSGGIVWGGFRKFGVLGGLL